MKPTHQQTQAMIKEWTLQKTRKPHAKTIFGIPVEHIEYALALVDMVAKGDVEVLPVDKNRCYKASVTYLDNETHFDKMRKELGL